MQAMPSVRGSVEPRLLPLVFAASLIAAPFALRALLRDGGSLGPRPNAGALEGPNRSIADPGTNNAGAANNRGDGVPTGGNPSPLFGAQPFTQQMLLFEEFGTEPLPPVFTPQPPFPQPQNAQNGPAPAAIDAFLGQTLFPAPTRLSNDRDENPWRQRIEAFLGRQLVTPPAEGRPPGEGWAHQRFTEFPPQVWFETVTAGARTNTGLRDNRQLHGYAVGEFAPGGLYHNTTGRAGSDGTAAGISVRFHPNLPIQQPNALWTFDGTLPPKLLLVRVGVPTLFRHSDGLPIDPAANFGFGLHTLTTHEHNGHQPGE